MSLVSSDVKGERNAEGSWRDGSAETSVEPWSYGSVELVQAARSEEFNLLCSSRELKVVAIAIDQVDSTDRRFQCRLSDSGRDLQRSLQLEGQQVPITLWGTTPHIIIDGFRRVNALHALGVSHVNAIVRLDLSEEQAFALAFTENARRKNYTALEKAHCIWVANQQRGMDVGRIASLFGLSTRQVHRYLGLLRLDPYLVEALDAERISMAHASLLHRYRPESLGEVVGQVVEHRLSAPQLKKLLKSSRSRRGRRRGLVLRTSGGGFRLREIHFEPSMPIFERERIKDALKQAISIVLAPRSEMDEPEV